MAHRIIVLGRLSTDISVLGVPALPGAGQDAFGPDLVIGPGGKSRNVATMIAALTGQDTVAMISHTSRDLLGLWRVPYDSLLAAGVNTDHVVVADDGSAPSVALVTVDRHGDRLSSVNTPAVPAAMVSTICGAAPLFRQAAAQDGLLAVSLEFPVEIVREAMRCAAECALRVVFDPGGAVGDVDCGLLLRSRCFLIKPNEYEARMLTGVEVQDMRSAARAAAVLREHGADYALITHGRAGGYLFGDGIATHIPIPRVPPAAQPDSTGCGDQVMAVLCSQLSLNVDVLSAARAAIAAGTLQFGRVGIEPVTPAELATYL